ncbi:MAG: site-specific DNA-methyltransferase, partial [Thermofilaceae archaeon]
IDTRYFDEEIKYELLSLFDNLDQELDGWLIKSENYQALITILSKFKEKVQTIYIDPPFNKEKDADYFYSVKFKDAIWATMLENRLRLAREFLKDTGSIFVRCDYNGNWILRAIMNEIFGKENFRNEIVVRRNISLAKTCSRRFEEETDRLLFYSKTENHIFNEIRIEKEPKWVPLRFRPGTLKEKNYLEIFGKRFYPPEGLRFPISQKTAERLAESGKIRENPKKPGQLEILYDLKIIGTNWTDIPGYSYVSIWGFKTENSEILLKGVIECSSNEGDLVMDFFLGSGTTIAVAHKLKRKWIGMEMGDHFYTIVLPRMKKVLAYDKSGISKEKDVKEKYNENNAGGFFKYFEVEQFEQTLRKVKYSPDNPFLTPGEDIYNQYIFMKDQKLLEALEVDYKNNKIKVDLSKLYSNIDIAETLSCLLGKMIKKISKDEVEFEDGTIINLKDLDYKLIKPLIWW